MDRELIVSSSPHLKSEVSTRGIMLDVIIALLFPLALAVFLFGERVIALTAVSVGCCIFFEYLFRRITQRDNTVGDLSAVVTGILIVFTLPATVPYWIPAVGAFFAIVIVKQLFGGLGQNFMNPALAARAFLFSWPTIMTTWPEHNQRLSLFSPDAVSTATPLKQIANGGLSDLELANMFIGQKPGSIGEVSVVLLILGGLYLVVRGVIKPRVPIVFIATVAAMTFLLAPEGVKSVDFMLAHIMSGGLMLGAIFMATDYATTPVTPVGQYLFAIGCGALTVVIRLYGSLPEGVCYAILIMNCLTFLLDRAGVPRRFGTKLIKFGKKGDKNDG